MTSVFDHKIISVIADVMYEISIETNSNHLDHHQNNSSSSTVTNNDLNDDKDESNRSIEFTKTTAIETN